MPHKVVRVCGVVDDALDEKDDPGTTCPSLVKVVYFCVRNVVEIVDYILDELWSVHALVFDVQLVFVEYFCEYSVEVLRVSSVGVVKHERIN